MVGEAHPRSRGENLAGAGGVIAVWGSSPLTRGKQRRVWLLAAVAGLIPAHAGKTAISGATPGAARAHPRSRGENAAGRWHTTLHLGSSPLTRGKLGELQADAVQVGLIPAHAGKTR